MISGWTALSRDSSKTVEGKALRGSGQIRSELRMSSKLTCPGFCPCRAKIRPAHFVSLCLRAIISRANVLPDIILSGSAGRCRQYLLLPEGFRRDERLRRVYRSPQQFIPAGFPLRDQPPHGDGRLSPPPSPHRTWSVPDASS